MKPKYRILVALLLLLFLSQAKDVNFKQLTVDNGLSQISVMSIFIDEKGFIWMGTRDGLNYYDGNEVVSFKPEKNSSSSSLGTNIVQITGNRAGDIYVLCREGITKYNDATESFSTLLVNKDIESIYYKDGLFATERNRILKYDEEHKEFVLFYAMPNINLNITSFLISEGNIWIGTADSGVFLLKDGKLSHVIQSGEVTVIYQDSDKDIWVGTWQHGCYRITDKGVVNYRHHNTDKRSVSSDFVRAFTEDDNGDIWIGTFNGLSLFNKKTTYFTTYNSRGKIGGLTDLSIWSLATDPQGTVWVGTYYGGLNYFNPKYEIYSLTRASSIEKDGLSYAVIGKIIEDKSGNLWICTEGGGLNFYDKEAGTFRWYSSSKKTADLTQDNVKAFYFDEKRQIVWIGLHLGGLNKIELATGKVSHYKHIPDDPNTIPSNVVLDILPYKDKLLVGTNNGVSLFSPDTGKSQKIFTNLKSNEMRFVRDMLFDNLGRLWLAVMNEGVYAYDFETNDLKKFDYQPEETNSLNSNKVYSLFMDSQGKIWVSTARGINVIDISNYKIESYDAKDGLVHEGVYEIRELNAGKMLLLTNQGVTVFDTSNRKFSNFNIINSFPVKSLNEGGLCVASDGKTYVGTVEGLLAFNVKDLVFRSLPYSIQFTKLWVNGDKVDINDNRNILHQSLAYTPTVKLQSKYHTFAVEYATSNFVAENYSRVVYRLDGFSDSWMDIQDQKRITFTNLNPGKYVLTIKAVDRDGNEISSQSIHIQILPHWSRSNLAYFIYFLLLAGVVYFIVKTNNKRIRAKENLKYEQKRIEDIERQNNAKLQFYTNVSHELRTPLTLIMGELEMIMQSGLEVSRQWMMGKLTTVLKNTKLLKELLNELLDFRKQEQGFIKLSVNRHDFKSFVQEIYELFKGYASDREITFNFVTDDESVEVWYDSKLMLKAVNNLLSNAFKFTNPGGQIRIVLHKNEDSVLLSVQDNGSGIPADEQEKIFNPFYQLDHPAQTEGKGIGLALTKTIINAHHGSITVESTVGEGSRFTIKLPFGNSHFEENQLEGDMLQQYETANLEIGHLLPDIEKSQHYNMLIVEDNLSLLNMLQELFSPCYHVTTAINGKEAWDKVERNLPDIVISDVLMPVMSGTALCKCIKENVETCHIPVILLTAQADITHNIEGLRIGADEYMSKPFEPILLISKAYSLMNNRVLLQEKFSKEPFVTAPMLASNPIDKEIMNKATRILEKNIDNPDFNIDMLASEMNMSRTILFSKLKAVTGQTPNDLISTFRLKRAAFLLLNNPEMNITEISTSVGFNSLRYFTKCFKEKYDQTPSAYRKKK